MAQRKLLTNGNAFKRTDTRWGGVVWYMDEQVERKRKSFSGTTKLEVNKKMKDYIADFHKQEVKSDEALQTLEASLQKWLEVFKFPSVERTTYDRNECVARHQVYPILGKKVVGDITSADVKKLLNHWMTEHSQAGLHTAQRVLPIPIPTGNHFEKSYGKRRDD